MSQNKTEQPTLKKQRDSRKKGNVAFSGDVSAAAILCGGLAVVVYMAGSAFSRWQRLAGYLWSSKDVQGGMSEAVLLQQAASLVLRLSAGVMLPAVTAGILAGILQTGFLFCPLKPDMHRINPSRGLKNLFTRKKCIEIIKTGLKILVTAGILTILAGRMLLPVLAVSSATLPSLVVCCCRISRVMLLSILILTAMYGGFDWILQRKLWLNALKMTKQEVQQEYRDAEGDPLIKHLRKQQYNEIVRSPVKDRVSRSRLVIVNPTRYAVAVEYHEYWTGAPRIAAKGYQHSAASIRQIAARYNVPVIHHPSMARRLYELGIDQEIPEELFRAVAELLIYVGRLSDEEKKKHR